MTLLYTVLRPVPFSDVRLAIDRMLRGFVGECRPSDGYAAAPPLNVAQDAKRLYVELEVPGVRQQDLDVRVAGGVLTIEGRPAPGKNDDTLVYHRRERDSREFVRVVPLPVEVDADHVEATLQDGVLTVVLPKTQAERGRKVEVRVA